MSAIYKLSIQGIRSFDSNDRETIEFGKPLTLIVGTNGSGKTTIIECLKYATSGDLPPNSKGGAFIHDPKITGEKDVRAQVKLAFTSANNLNMIVTRNIQLLVKKTTATFKTLEGQLVIVNNNGGRNTLSTRSVELDAQVPLYMGVPRAILEYVIFCHQEDSLWPLSEPSNLKKKFDEIFQAMKFTKALDSLKTIRKDMSVDIKLLKQTVEHLKVDKDRSEGTKLKMRQLEDKVDKYNCEVKEIEKRIALITEESDKLFKSNQDFQKILSKFENLKHTRDSTREQISRLSNAIDVLDCSKGELENRLKNFSSLLIEKEQKMNSLKGEVERMKVKYSVLQNECNTLIRKQGELNAAKDAHEKNLKSFKELHNNLSLKYPSLPNSLDDKQFLKELEAFKKRVEVDCKSFNEEGKSGLSHLENELSSVKNSKVIQNERLEYTKMDKRKLVEETDRLDTELHLSEFSEENLMKETETLEKFTKKLNNWEKNHDIDKINIQIKSKNKEMIIIEADLETIQDKISKTNQQADLFAKLSIVKKLIQEKDRNLKSLEESFKKHDSVVKLGLSHGPNIEMEFKKITTKLRGICSHRENEFREVDVNFTEMSVNLRNSEKELNRTKTENDNVAKKLDDALPDDCPLADYYEVVAESESSYRTALENLKMHQTTLAFNMKAIEVAENESCCYLCSRKFESEHFKSSILSKLKAKTNVEFERSLKGTVENEKEYLNSLRHLEKDVIAFESSSDKLKLLRKKIEDMGQIIDSLTKNRENLRKAFLDSQEDAELVERELGPMVESIVRFRKELRDLNDDLETISDELAVYGSAVDDVQTVSELQEIQRKNNDLLRSLRKDISQLQDEKEEKSREYTNLVSLVKERSMKVTEIEKELSLTKNIQVDIKNKRDQLRYINSTINNVEKEVRELEGKIEILENEERRKRSQFDSKVSEMSTDLRNIEDDIKSFIRAKAAIQDVSSEEADELKSCTNLLAVRQEELSEVSAAIENTTSLHANESQNLKDSANQKRVLEQNLQLFDLKLTLMKVEKEVNEIDISNAEVERDKFQEESSRLRKQYEKLSSENAGKLGEVRQLQNQIRSLAEQLRTEYRDVENQFHEKWVELQTRTFVTDDIETYSKALDSAIMRYHGLKMQDINRIIDELWKRTYSGTDVDTIQIRSDEVGRGVRDKSYNYRVVMFKQDAELDMRGRCSAGQKVLASIIIRLALSETFGVNCGVIALDEPTTNLDEENIESLAKSLSNIIQLRRHQKNFQLIVITHDEKFLNYMGASEFTDHFFRVKRDDRQKSQIEWVAINKVMN